MRYLYDLFKLHVWRDMFFWKPFWRAWGVKQTLVYIFLDTFVKHICRSYYEKLVKRGKAYWVPVGGRPGRFYR